MRIPTFKIGDKWRVRRELWHFVATAGDGDTVLVVYKRWVRRKQRWYYYCEDVCGFVIMIDYNGEKV